MGPRSIRGSTRDISATECLSKPSIRSGWVPASTARLTLDRPVRLDCFVKRIEPGRGMGVSVPFQGVESQKTFSKDLLSTLRHRFLIRFYTKCDDTRLMRLRADADQCPPAA